jgi:hypothetical protein
MRQEGKRITKIKETRRKSKSKKMGWLMPSFSIQMNQPTRCSN